MILVHIDLPLIHLTSTVGVALKIHTFIQSRMRWSKEDTNDKHLNNCDWRRLRLTNLQHLLNCRHNRRVRRCANSVGLRWGYKERR
jgi:hypothetical protein